MKNYNSKSKIGFVFVLFKTPEEERQRLLLEIMEMGLENYKVYFIDNTGTGKGYAEGVNKGIRKAVSDRCDLFVVANPDISIKKITKTNLLAGARHFDLWGLAMKQQGEIYYGGKIDRWLLTGGLITTKPNKRFIRTEWVSGSLMLIKKSVIDKVGYFSEDYFMYYEDVDYGYRATKAGLRVGIDSATTYEHYEVSVSNPKKKQFLTKARNKFYEKYADMQQRMYGAARLPKILFGNFWIKGGFFVSFASLNISALINKLLNFLLFIFLIRILNPNEYGIYTLVWAQVSLFSPIVDLGTTSYGIIHLSSEKKHKLNSLFNLRLIVAIIVFFLTVITGTFIFKENKRIIVYLMLTSFVIFSNLFSGSYLIKNSIQGKLYNSAIVSSIFNSILIFFLIVSIAVFKSLPVVFLLTFIFYVLYAFINYFLINKDFTKGLRFSVNLIEWKELLKGSYKYVLIAFFAGIYFKIDVFLLQNIKGETDVGIYSAGYKFFEGLMFIAASYNISRAPIFARLIKKSKKLFINTVNKDMILLATIGLGIAVLFYLLSPLVLPVFLKRDYRDSLGVAKIVMFALPFILVSSIFLNAIYVLRKAEIVIAIFSLQAVMNFFLNLIFIPKFSYLASSYITVFTEIINTLVLFSIFRLLTRKKYENIT